MHGVNWLCALERAGGIEKSNSAHATISARIAASDGRSGGASEVGFVSENRRFWFIGPPVREKVVSPYSRARCALGLPMAQLLLAKPGGRFKIEEKFFVEEVFFVAGALRSARSIAQRHYQMQSIQHRGHKDTKSTEECRQ